MPWLAGLRCCLVAAMVCGVASAHADDDGLSDREIIALLYGDNPFASRSLAVPRWSGDKAYASVALNTSVREHGKARIYAAIKLTPEPADKYSCHGCAPGLQFAVFEERAGQWRIMSRTRELKFSSAWGTHITLSEIGTDAHGILIRSEDVFQGYESRSNALYVVTGDDLKEMIEDGFADQPGPGACEDNRPACGEQSATLAIHPVEAADYFPVTTELRYNVGKCGGSIRQVIQRKMYRFIDGKYVAE